MTSRDLPFMPVWIGFNLGAARPCDRTYCRYALDELAPLPGRKLDGTFHWLANADSAPAGRPPGWIAKQRQALLAQTTNARVTLPKEFLAFMDNDGLISQFRSPTDCSFEYPRGLIPRREDPGEYFVHFYSDSQDCYHWYLHAGPHQNCTVVACTPMLDPNDDDLDLEDLEEEDFEEPALFSCAPSFESFLHRLWLENEIYFRLADKDQPLSPEMQEYLQFYSKAP